MGIKRRITEYLDIELEKELWCCNRCGCELGPARENYKTFCLVYERDPQTIHPSYNQNGLWDYGLAPDPDWCRIIEYYCPECATMLEVEYLPPGHPITWDIQLDIDSLKRK